MIEQFYLTHRWDPNKYYQSGVRVDLGVMLMKGYSPFAKVPQLDPQM